MNFDDLTDDTLELYLFKFYINPNCVSKDEYMEDVKRFKYVKRLLKKYYHKDELRERLILNHLIILGNVFTPEIVTRVMFLKMDPKYYPCLKTFLVFLNYMPTAIKNINGAPIVSSDIPLDQKIIDQLRKI